MNYDSLFQRYGQPSREADIRISGYLIRPDCITEAKGIDWMNKSASRLIAECESLAEKLKEYRQDIAARYGELETMPYTRLLKLERCPHWKGHIEYIVTITRAYPDKTVIDELREVYPGKERKKAFERTAQLLKQYPGIPYEKDIEKRSWER